MSESPDTSLGTDLARQPLRPMIALGVVGALLLAVITVLVFAGSGGEDPTYGVLATDDSPEAVDQAPGEAGGDDNGVDPDPAPEAAPVVTYEVYLNRDPFEPVRTPIVAETSNADPIVTDPDTDGPVDTEPTDPDDNTAPRDPSEPGQPAEPRDPSEPDRPEPLPEKGCTGGDEETVCNGQVVSLVDVTSNEGQRVAVVQIDTTLYEVREGDRFATHFFVRSVGASEVTLAFGDDTFRLSEGDRVMK
jgi:hypothetical protein